MRREVAAHTGQAPRRSGQPAGIVLLWASWLRMPTGSVLANSSPETTTTAPRLFHGTVGKPCRRRLCHFGVGRAGNETLSPETLPCAPALKVFRPEPIWPIAGLTTS